MPERPSALPYTLYRVPPPPKRRRWVTVLKWVGLVVVALAAGAGGVAYGWFAGSLKDVASATPEVRAVVSRVRTELTVPEQGEPVNILLLGSDRRESIGEEVGRSDTLIVVRLDPTSKSVAMLSIPRDLRVYIPGYGTDKINAAYSTGGPALAVKTVRQLTGLPINHFVDVNFLGFVHVIDKLGGAYMMVDRRYYNPRGTGFAAIDLEAGYQRLTGRETLSFVRFRHDPTGDFGRMARQQMFLREFKRQMSASLRWTNLRRLPELIRIVTKNVISDIDSPKKLYGLAHLALEVDTSRIYQVRVTGGTSLIDGVSYVEASPEDIAAAVAEFRNPAKPPVRPKVEQAGKEDTPVLVLNGSGAPGIAGTLTSQLRALGYRAASGGNAEDFDYESSAVYTTSGFEREARRIADMLGPADVMVLPRTPGRVARITVVAGSSFTGQLAPPPAAEDQPSITVVRNTRQNLADWQALAKGTGVRVRMPTVWAANLSYDDFRAYTIATTAGRRAAAVVVVGKTWRGGYWDIMETRWKDPPIVAHPNEQRLIEGTRYGIFYEGKRIRMVSWRKGSTVYWITNTLDNELPNDFMLTLASSFTRVK